MLESWEIFFGNIPCKSYPPPTRTYNNVTVRFYLFIFQTWPHWLALSGVNLYSNDVSSNRSYHPQSKSVPPKYINKKKKVLVPALPRDSRAVNNNHRFKMTVGTLPEIPNHVFHIFSWEIPTRVRVW